MPGNAYQVLSPLRHDGRLFKVGETVEMAEGQAEALVAAGRLTPVPASDRQAPKRKRARSRLKEKKS